MAVGLCTEFWVYTEGEGASDDPLNVGVDVSMELLEVAGANSHQNLKLCSLVGETGNHFNSINSIYGLQQAHPEMKVGASWLKSPYINPDIYFCHSEMRCSCQAGICHTHPQEFSGELCCATL